MAHALRGAWVLTTILKKLNDALERRDGDPGSLKAGEILDTIGPSGELRLPGGTGKLLQVIEIDPTEDPCTVVLTDKKVKIACKISSDARRKHESSSKTKISTITGCAIKVLSYDIYFPGADGKLFWEGARDRSQIVVKPASQNRKAGKKEIQKNNMGDKSIKQDLGIGNKNADAELLPMPEPIFFITEFAILPGGCSDVRGNPKSVSSKADLKPLLSGLPRKARSGREFSLSQYVPLPRKSSNEPSASSKVSADDESSDYEIRSQTDVYSGDVSSQDVSQLLFTTQDHLNTFDDLQFPEYKIQKKKPGANHPQNLIAIRGSLEPSAHDQGKKKTSKPHAHHARKNAEQTSLNTEPKFINYADWSDSEEPFVSSAVGWEGDSKDLSQTSNNRNKRKRGDLSTSFPSPDIGRRKGRKKSLGWGKMEQITPSQTIIPDDQLEILNRPECECLSELFYRSLSFLYIFVTIIT
ncbi:hypothetical protein DFP73DRAFT_549932 [Morchella snyderi]|nr:hypothetical protein DFP73DRAFT_549932 [Morchella snyderi]